MRLDKSVGDLWRFRCIYCNSHDIRKIFSGKRSRTNEYVVGGVGQKQANKDRSKRMRCNSCSKRTNRVYDKKKEKEVTYREILQ